jgi:hypothetical protein
MRTLAIQEGDVYIAFIQHAAAAMHSSSLYLRAERFDQRISRVLASWLSL